MNNTRNVSTPSLHVFFLLFHIMMIWRNSNINLHNIYYVQRRQRKREMRSWLFFMCFKCTYKLLCPVALLFIHHFIIKCVHHLLCAFKTWFQCFMTCARNWHRKLNRQLIMPGVWMQIKCILLHSCKSHGIWRIWLHFR